MHPFLSICALALTLSHVQAAPTKSAAAKKKAATAKPGAKSNAAARNRKSSPPRQQTPTTERYLEIQQALASKGFYKGEPNGKWDADSVDALKRFQADRNLEPDGKLGSLSLIALGLGPKHEPASDLAVPPRPAAPQEGKQ